MGGGVPVPPCDETGGIADEVVLGTRDGILVEQPQRERAVVDGLLGLAKVEPGSGADKAGLKASTGTTTIAGVQYPTGGDVITSIDGTKVATAQQLRAIIDQHQPGDVVKLDVSHGGQTRTVSATLGTRTSS